MSNLKEDTKEKVPVTPILHKIKFKKEPIWLKCNFVGKYNGIKFRFMYHEYTSEDVDEVIKRFSFTWPGRIPDDKGLAEKGIKALFIQIKNNENSSIVMEVSKDEVIFTAENEEETIIDEIVQNEMENADEEMREEIIKEINEDL